MLSLTKTTAHQSSFTANQSSSENNNGFLNYWSQRNKGVNTNKGGYRRPEKSRKWESLFIQCVFLCVHIMLSG